MDLQYIKRLIKIVNESLISEIEIEEEGKRVRITRTPASADTMPTTVQHFIPAATQTSQTVGSVQEQAPAPAPEAASSYHEVRSPIVGTFYRSPTPDAEPYAQVGQVVSVGHTLCIIEAMKIMNDIEADVSGRIVKVLVENAQPVEYNQPLFLIDPS
jgi:acetyl-CoA carboxylase biotin carboxyl carrier protein